MPGLAIKAEDMYLWGQQIGRLYGELEERNEGVGYEYNILYACIKLSKDKWNVGFCCGIVVHCEEILL